MSKLIKDEFHSDLIPAPMRYAVLLPDGYEDVREPYPLLYALHGGGGNGWDTMTRLQVGLEQAWQNSNLPKLVAVAPTATLSFWMDYKDGSQLWEKLLIGPFLTYLRQTYKVRQDRDGMLVFGASMGGMGGLRLTFKHPDIFGAVAGLEPGIEAALDWKDVTTEDRWYRGDERFTDVFGNPVDEEYWAANNPASIAARNARKLVESKLAIYLDCGDEDSFGLYRGTEFLHRVLADNAIPHEYHLIRGSDHIGTALAERTQDALKFLGKFLNPPPVDPLVTELRTRLKASIGLRSTSIMHSPTAKEIEALRNSFGNPMSLWVSNIPPIK